MYSICPTYTYSAEDSPQLKRVVEGNGDRAIKESQQRHLNRVVREFVDLVKPKFEKGAREHKDLLHEKSPEWLLDAAIEEAIDQVTYLLTLKERLNAQDGTDRT